MSATAVEDTELAIRTESATWHRLNRARRNETSLLSSLGSIEPTSAVTAAAGGRKDHPHRHEEREAETQVNAAPRRNGKQLNEGNQTGPEDELEVRVDIPDGGVRHEENVRRHSERGTITTNSNASSDFARATEEVGEAEFIVHHLRPVAAQ